MNRNTRIISCILAMLLLMAFAIGCTQAPAPAPQETAPVETPPAEPVAELFTPGSYQAEGQGNNGPITVETVFDAEKIIEINILAHTETAGISDAALDRIPTQIVEGQTLNVDTVTGATNTSKGILTAVTDCVAQAGGDVNALLGVASTGTQAQGELIEKQVDLLIIGGGASGLTAANAALEQGVGSVLLLEKMPSLGGASSMAGGLAGGCSDLQISMGITNDTPELIYEDIMRGGKNTNDPELVKVWSEEMGPVFNWLVNTQKVPIENTFSNFPEHTVQRSYYVTGGSSNMIKILGENFTAAGGELMMETTATEFKVEDGVVTGAMAEDAAGNTLDITAKATILASGGFGNNQDMLSEKLAIALFYGAVSSTGEGIQMAQNIGAKLSFMDFAKMYPQGIEVSPNFARVATVHSMLTTQETGAIYVNKEGKRVINENLDFVSIKDKTTEQTDHLLFLVMDQTAYDKWSVLAHGDENSSPAGRFTFEEQEQWFNTPDGVPIFRRGDNLEEVAAAAGIDGAALRATLEEWNEQVAEGTDAAFGRTQLFPFAMDGTYYIIEHKLRFATTLGGVCLNENFEVLNETDQPIPGLYAAGECVGGVHGEESMPTCMLSWAVTSGKIVGDKVSPLVK